MYYSAWDKQCNRHLAAGLNSKTKKQLISALCGYFSIDHTTLELKTVKSELLKCEEYADIIIEKHPELIQKNF